MCSWALPSVHVIRSREALVSALSTISTISAISTCTSCCTSYYTCWIIVMLNHVESCWLLIKFLCIILPLHVRQVSVDFSCPGQPMATCTGLVFCLAPGTASLYVVVFFFDILEPRNHPWGETCKRSARVLLWKTLDRMANRVEVLSESCRSPDDWHHLVPSQAASGTLECGNGWSGVKPSSHR